ncbi:MAG: cytochrome c [Pseudomonadota bacterium]|nr:cytochrome c [Pseudomonadota bacterium]
MRLLYAVATVALLAACREQAAGDRVVEEANASGNAASNALENAVAQSDAAPLEKEQALALMKERHENYERIGDSMKVITRQLKSGSPDLAQVRSNADTIAQLAPQVSTWFPAGTGPDVGKTEAKSAIWENRQDFAAKAEAFNQAAMAFQRTAQGSDLAAIRAAHGNLGKSCKACHDLYREEH